MNRVMVYMLYFAIYTVLLLMMGKNGFKKTNTIKDFCVAGNSLGLFISVSTFTATLFSAVSMQSVTGSVYLYGYSPLLYSVVGWLLGCSLLIFVANRIKNYDIATIPEYFKIRYHSSGYQAFTGSIIVLCYILYIVIQIKGFGIVVSELLDINYNVAILLIYLFVVYTSFGGLFSVSKTDALNLIMICLGICIIAAAVLLDYGGITAIHEKAVAISEGALLDATSNGYFSPLMIITTGMAWGLGTAANPQYIIRISSAKNKKTAIQMVCLATIILSIMYLGLLVVGLGARAQESSPVPATAIDEMLSYFVHNNFGAYISGIMFISIIAASISTANSQLLLLAGSFNYDVYRNLFKKDISHDKFLNMNRLVIFIAGTISLILAVNPVETLLIYGSYIWSIFSVTYLCPLYGGLYWKKATKEGAIYSSIAGMAVLLTLYLADHFYGFGENIHPVLPATVVSAAVFYAVSRRTYQEEGYEA